MEGIPPSRVFERVYAFRTPPSTRIRAAATCEGRERVSRSSSASRCCTVVRTRDNGDQGDGKRSARGSGQREMSIGVMCLRLVTATRARPARLRLRHRHRHRQRHRHRHRHRHSAGAGTGTATSTGAESRAAWKQLPMPEKLSS